MKTTITLAFLLGILTMKTASGQDGAMQHFSIQAVYQQEVWKNGKAFFDPALGDSVSITRFCVYLSQIELLYEDGTSVLDKNFHQLVDTDDLSSLKFSTRGKQNAALKALRFQIGVDSLTCVSGALDGALDPANGMYWAWNSGYINAKLEGRCKQIPTREKQFEFHIGGYLAPYASVQQVEIPVQNLASGEVLTLNADLSKWFKNLDLKQNHTIVMPGEEALKMAQRYAHMFSQASK